MAWGAPRGIDDLVERVGRSDPSLTSLCVLRMRRVDDDGCRRLAEALAGNTVLEELSLASHAVSPAAAAAFAAALGSNRTLRSLDLGNSSFGDEGLEALAPGIAASPSLRCLNLEGKGVTSAGCRALRDAMAQHSSSGTSGGGLEELLMGRNAIGGDGLAALLAAFGSSLVSLDLSACGLAGDADLASLAEAFTAGALPLLRTLRLDGNDLSSAAQLGDSLAAAASSGSSSSSGGSGSNGLQQLHLQRCGLGGSAAARLAAALPSGLATLDLSGNAIGSDGAAALATALSTGAGQRLSKLALCSCGLDDAGIEALAAALGGSDEAAGGGTAAADVAGASTAAGLALDLSGNVAGPAAMMALAAAPLASLCLHDCQLGSGEAAGAAALTQQLATAGSFARLQELDISANHLESAQLLPLLEALAQVATGAGGSPAACPRLRLLVIAANPGAASEEVSAAVERLHERRPGLDVVRRAADTGEGGLMGR